MSSEDEPTFEQADAGASHTAPQQAGTLRKGGFVMLKGKPCKIVDISTSKTGKHGHAKANITGLDIFTGRKYEDICPTSHNMEVPNVVRAEYQLLNVDESGAVSLLNDDATTKDDLDLPKNENGIDEVGQQIQNDFNEGKGVIVTVIAACGQEKIVSSKTIE
ncbi:Eukaryotic translation initiation factor 5A-1 [Perkinsus chesapeaki]|uniref:Eukaryotic translation initiation factor 5A n=1 Tax=Perkinsus chesapeaki TaxID=330153 RepID=A0A7J6LD12_PERCH|nr:Eukaryotic translation initiation factor 5A-1 [Perkinsus chesapeaki]|mmetsp:Transcript_9947/g.12074  ORF Transcript_9947/g.12074 Transcript_9947/m.12074 type:complete len:162 (+) Transcript_9947:73-558(+)